MTNKLCFSFVLAVFLALPVFIPSAEAEYLLLSGRDFESGLFTAASDIHVADATGDAIPDIILGSDYYEDAWPIIFTLPGLGDGAFGEPVTTFSPMPRGDSLSIASGMLDGDQHVDLVITYDEQEDDHFGALVLLGNGDGTFTPGHNQIVSFEAADVVIAELTGDAHTDFAITEVSGTGPAVHVYSGAGDGTFSSGSRFEVGELPHHLATGDFDDDGDMDMVSGGYNVEAITVLLNNGSGTFSTAGYDASGEISTLATGDLNDDGYDDLVAGCGYQDASLMVYFGSAAGTLSPMVEYEGGDDLYSLALGDVDNDGDIDIAANTGGPDIQSIDMVSVLLNNGDGTFGDAAYYFRGGRGIGLHDVNGDGALDAVMTGWSGSATVLLGAGDGTFPAMTDLLAGEDGAADVAHADVDLDGDLDLALACPSNEIYAARILLNNGDGSFAGPADYYAGSDPMGLLFGDLNGDRYPEMVILNGYPTSSNSISVMVNNGDGTYGDRRGYECGYYTSDAGLADLDGDGDLDIAVCYFDQLGILLNPGNGVFSGITSYPSILPVDMALADADGDGDIDAVIAGESNFTDTVSLLANNGDGSFAPPSTAAGIGAANICLTDLDGDGAPDLVASDDYSSRIQLRLNNGSGRFNNGMTEYTLGDDITDLASGDINLDGHADVFALTNSVTILLGAGDGTIAEIESYPNDSESGDLDAADFDGNGTLDFAATGPYRVPVSIFFHSGSSSGLLATGPGRGEFNPTLVRVFAAGAIDDPTTQWSAYGIDRWGVNVTLGELNGAGAPEVLTGAGPGAVFGPHVRGFDISGTPLPGMSFLAYGTNKWGVNVCSGDLDNDGFHEIVTGAGPGAVFGPHVRGWNWDGDGTPAPIPGISYFAYGTPKFGVNVSCGDIDGDGYDEIVTGAGPGTVYGPHVRGWNCDGGGATAIGGVSFLAYGTNQWGVNVCCGDIDGDGIDEMVTGPGPGVVFGPHVRGWNWDGDGSAQAISAVSFFAYPYTQWGANVSCGDLDGDGIDEIITGPGPGPDLPARVRGFNYDGQTLTALGGIDFLAYEGSGSRYGVKVAGTR